jgi:predicted ArsR family transcriptional regulator
MQATRERILNILKERGDATVKELSGTLDLTTVTVRHHLDTLRRENFVAAPTVRHRKAPGRPQHVYALTEDASDFFPKRYEPLIGLLLDELRARLPQDEVDDLMVSIGRTIADEVAIPPDTDLEERISIVVDFMDERGYMARWEGSHNGDYRIHVANCPYESVARRHAEVCQIDQAFLTELLDPSLAKIKRIPDPPHECTYVIRPVRAQRPSGNRSGLLGSAH